MKKVMPQEVQVWYLIPAIRRDLAKTFVKDYDLSQKEASEILGITESAISQYLKSKRGAGLKFNKEESAKIKEAAEKIISDKNKAMHHLFHLSNELMGSKSICDFHRKHDGSLSKDCVICMRKQ